MNVNEFQCQSSSNLTPVTHPLTSKHVMQHPCLHGTLRIAQVLMTCRYSNRSQWLEAPDTIIPLNPPWFEPLNHIESIRCFFFSEKFEISASWCHPNLESAENSIRMRWNQNKLLTSRIPCPCPIYKVIAARSIWCKCAKHLSGLAIGTWHSCSPGLMHDAEANRGDCSRHDRQGLPGQHWQCPARNLRSFS